MTIVSDLRQRLTSLLGREDGQTMAEYAVVLAVITVATVAVFTALSGGISGASRNVTGLLSRHISGTPLAGPRGRLSFPLIARPASMPVSNMEASLVVEIETDVVSDELAMLVHELACAVDGEDEVMLAMTRGAPVPAGILAYRLKIREHPGGRGAAYYDEGGILRFTAVLQFPGRPLALRGPVLVVDEVGEMGTTIQAGRERVRSAGGIPTTAAPHDKPLQTRMLPHPPDHHVVETDKLGQASCSREAVVVLSPAR